MKRGIRVFYRNCVHHCYQNTPDGFLLFYNVGDFLLYFTILCTVAQRHPVKVLKVCPMVDHIHQSILAPDKTRFSAYMKEVTSLFAREHNRVCHSRGPVFNSPFGSAPKTSDKKIRTNLIYVDNNPVERKLVHYAEEYRWNFLAYASSNHPFSEKLVLRNARYPLQQAVRMVKRQHSKGNYLSYALLQRLFSPLTRPEKEQLIDFIISVYNVIDYQYSIRFFGSLENMLISTHANTGSEFDINESFTGKTDAVYPQITRLLLDTGRFKDIHDVLALSPEARMDLFQWLLPRTDALPDQVAKYLHIKLVRTRPRR